MHSLTMNWSNETSISFNPSNISVIHGTNPVFTPNYLPANGNSSVFVDQSMNLGPGPVGNYTWQPQTGGGSVGCYYDHPSTSGQTTVSVTPNGFQVSFDGKNWSTTTIYAHPTGHNITQPIYVRAA